MAERWPDAVGAAIEAELRLLDPAVRASPELLAELLHPEYEEYGTSGRLWTRASIMEALGERRTPVPRPIATSRMRGAQLAESVVHLTFDTESGGRRAHRSSVWRLTEGVWLLYFHQATRFEAAGTDGAH
ncbi:nuclear transport factor 2 family protein [Streptomyces sp. C10-9-1]|uniref:nuclear transport factor 2 family protein n=1 Tax=Streptomyces sp. C10-9-1 TaxID=1859285 RepID=UPI0021119B9C|nr:nuclear transport factor 2 family protein [Streptomyces sp. C10-9-1]MCQ6551871.1 nuclear transport factor 2 family protein [Streptomyces sp. C10-9-1]